LQHIALVGAAITSLVGERSIFMRKF
jgi:hypothetical protein